MGILLTQWKKVFLFFLIAVIISLSIVEGIMLIRYGSKRVLEKESKILLPDLLIRAEDVEVTTPVYGGIPPEYHVWYYEGTLYNIGENTASNVEIYAYKSNCTTKWYLVGVTVIDLVLPNSNVNFSIECSWFTQPNFTSPFPPLEPAFVFSKLVVDPLNEIIESNETNNEAVSVSSSVFYIYGPTIKVGKIAFSKEKAVEGETVEITSDIENLWDEDITNLTISLKIDNIVIEEKTIAILHSNTTLQISFMWKAIRGKHYVFIYAWKENAYINCKPYCRAIFVSS